MKGIPEGYLGSKDCFAREVAQGDLTIVIVQYFFSPVPVKSTLSMRSCIFEEESEGREAVAGSLSASSFPRMKTPFVVCSYCCQGITYLERY